MPNIVRIKRRVSGAAGAPASLSNAELAFNEVDNTLYYGFGDVAGNAITVQAIAGAGAFVSLTGSQTISGPKTFTGALTSTITLAAGDNSNAVATTAWVIGKINSISGGVTTFNGRSGTVVLSSADINAALGYTPVNYTLPAATQSSLGGVKIGAGITLTGDTISVSIPPSGVTSFNGRTGDVTLTTAEITAITDPLYLKQAAADNRYVQISGGTITGSLTIGGNLSVLGTTTSVNEATITVTDKVITLGKVTSPTDGTAQGGGIILLGTTNKTLLWDSTLVSWVSSENIGVASGKNYKIGAATVLDSTTLGSTVVNSSLTRVGTITTGTWNGTILTPAYGGTGAASLTGLIKGNGASAMTVAVAGTDYLTPSTTIDGGTF